MHGDSRWPNSAACRIWRPRPRAENGGEQSLPIFATCFFFWPPFCVSADVHAAILCLGAAYRTGLALDSVCRSPVSPLDSVWQERLSRKLCATGIVPAVTRCINMVFFVSRNTAACCATKTLWVERPQPRQLFHRVKTILRDVGSLSISCLWC